MSNNAPTTNSTNGTHLTPADFSGSEENAQGKVQLCRHFLAMAAHTLESFRTNQSNGGSHPSDEYLESALELRRQWHKDLLENEGRTGYNEVLKDPFLHEAKQELERLDGFDEAEATEGARAAWNHVEKLVADCKEWRQRVDAEMGPYIRPRAGSRRVD